MRIPQFGVWPRLLLLLVLVHVVTACTSAAPAELVGRWRLSEGSRQYLPAEVRSAVARLNLESDGTFTADELPEVRLEASGRVVLTRSGHGSWKILNLGGTDRVVLSFTDHVGTQFDISMSAFAPPKLRYYLSDPDSGRWFELERAN